MDFNIWPEKYRPNSLDKIIMDDKLKKEFQKYIDNCLPNNLIFSGPPGVGKSSTARIILNSLRKKTDIFWLNSSDPRGVAFFKEQIKMFVSTKSFTQRKIVFIDEGERLTPEAFDALKDLTENYWKNSSFIIVTNHLHKVPDAIKSRFIIYEFKKPLKEESIKYYENVLKSENISYKKEDLEKVYNRSNGDLRRSLNIMRKNIIDNNLIFKNNDYNDIFSFIKNSDIKGLKKYLSENLINYDEIYRNLYEKISSIDGILVIGRYLYQHSMIVDPEINFVCCVGDLIKLKKIRRNKNEREA